MDYMAPLSVAAMALPPATLRNDLGAIFTLGRFASAVMKTIPVGPKLQAPFLSILEELEISDPFIKNWLSLLCFLLQGMPPEGTMTAVMAYMLVSSIGGLQIWCVRSIDCYICPLIRPPPPHTG